MTVEQARIFMQPSVNETVNGIVKMVKLVEDAGKLNPELLIFTGGMANIQPYRNEVEKKFWSWSYTHVVYLLTANPAVGIKFTNKPEKIYWMECV